MAGGGAACTTQQRNVRLCLTPALFYTCMVESAYTWVLLSPTSRKGMNDKGLFLDVSGCCQGKNIMLVLYYYHCNHEPRYITRIKVRSKTALTWGPAKQNCNVFPLSLCTRVCCALWMYLCYHQCRYTNRPRVRLQKLCEEVLYLMGCSPCKASTEFIKAPRAHFACVLMLSCRNSNSCNLNARCQSAIGTVVFCRICVFLGGLPHAGEVDSFWRRLAGEGTEFAPLRKASKNKFIQQLAG